MRSCSVTGNKNGVCCVSRGTVNEHGCLSEDNDSNGP